MIFLMRIFNYYLMSSNKEPMQTYFAEKSIWGVHDEEYSIVDEPYLRYRCHLNKLSCGGARCFRSTRLLIVFGNWRRFLVVIYPSLVLSCR